MKIEPYLGFLRDRMVAFPQLSAAQLLREIGALGFAGSYSIVKYAVQGLRPPPARHFEHRFETAAGEQAQVDFAQFRAVFTEDPQQIVTPREEDLPSRG